MIDSAPRRYRRHREPPRDCDTAPPFGGSLLVRVSVRFPPLTVSLGGTFQAVEEDGWRGADMRGPRFFSDFHPVEELFGVRASFFLYLSAIHHLSYGAVKGGLF